MEDVWVETVHETERRDGKKNNSARVSEDEASAQGRRERSPARKDNRGQERKRPV